MTHPPAFSGVAFFVARRLPHLDTLFCHICAACSSDSKLTDCSLCKNPHLQSSAPCRVAELVRIGPGLSS